MATTGLIRCLMSTNSMFFCVFCLCGQTRLFSMPVVVQSHEHYSTLSYFSHVVSVPVFFLTMNDMK